MRLKLPVDTTTAAPNVALVGKSILDGIWELVRAELAGEAAPELVTRKTAVELADGAYFVRFDGQIMDRGSFAISGASDANLLVLQELRAGGNLFFLLLW